MPAAERGGRLAGIDRDLLAPPGAVEELHGKVPRFTHAPIANAAHSLHWEAPAAVAREINAFLR